MALTIETQPQQYQPVWHDQIIEASSTLISEDEFKFVFELVNTLAGRTIKVSPRPVDGFGFLNLKRHLQDMVDSELFDIKETANQVSAWANYSIRVKEEYKDGSGNIVTGPATIISSLAGLNSILSRNDILTYNQSNYKLTSTTSQLLWSIENNIRVLTDDLFFIHYAIGGTSQTLRFIVKEYFNNGTNNTIVEVVSATSRANLKTLDLFSKLTDPTNTSRIEVWFEDVGLNQVSEIKNLYLQTPCTTYTRHKIIYLDPKGSRSSLNFDQVSNQSTTVKPKVYQKFINAATQEDTSRPLTRYFVESDEVFTVNSAILSEKHNSMIRDLLKSTEVWLDVRNDERFPDPSVEFIPIEILTKQFKDAKSENQQLLQKPIQFRYSFEEVTR
jgi:hypothetical protein